MLAIVLFIIAVATTSLRHMTLGIIFNTDGNRPGLNACLSWTPWANVVTTAFAYSTHGEVSRIKLRDRTVVSYLKVSSYKTLSNCKGENNNLLWVNLRDIIISKLLKLKIISNGTYIHMYIYIYIMYIMILCIENHKILLL